MLFKIVYYDRKLLLISMRKHVIMKVEMDKRDGDIGQISQWIPFCLYGYVNVKATST